MRQRLGEGWLQHFLEGLIRSVLGHVTIMSARISLRSKSDQTSLCLKLFKDFLCGAKFKPHGYVGWPGLSTAFFLLFL